MSAVFKALMAFAGTASRISKVEGAGVQHSPQRTRSLVLERGTRTQAMAPAFLRAHPPPIPAFRRSYFAVAIVAPHVRASSEVTCAGCQGAQVEEAKLQDASEMGKP